MTDTILSLNGVLPPPRIYRPSYRWIVCDVPALLDADGNGLAVEVLVNINGAEEIELKALHDAWIAADRALASYGVALSTYAAALKQAEADGTESPERPDDDFAELVRTKERSEEALLRAIAPRIRRWNAQAETPGGEVVTIPSPVEALGGDPLNGWQALYTIPRHDLIWLVGAVRFAHVWRKDDPKGGTPSSASAPTSVPSGGPRGPAD